MVPSRNGLSFFLKPIPLRELCCCGICRNRRFYGKPVGEENVDASLQSSKQTYLLLPDISGPAIVSIGKFVRDLLVLYTDCQGALPPRMRYSGLPGDRAVRVGVILCSFAALVGCAISREPTRTPRTAIEQLLLSHAVQRSMNALSLPLSPVESVAVEVAAFPTDRLLLQDRFIGEPNALPVVPAPATDLVIVHGLAEGRLGVLGFPLQQSRLQSTYFLRLLVLALGTDQAQTFFGMPAVQGGLLPFALPELTLFKAQRQKAYMRYRIDIYESATGRFIRSTPWYEGSAYFNQYVVFFFISFKSTDLPQTP